MNNSTEKIIEKSETDIFTDTELANILAVPKNSRYGLVKRMIAKGDIIHIRKGLYCLAPKYQRQRMNLFSLAQRVYGPSYVSFESAMSYHNWIPEAVHSVTCACMKSSKDFYTPLGNFSYKRIPTREFFSFVQRIDAGRNNVFFVAHPFKALLDYVYINKKEWKDLKAAMDYLRIERDSFAGIMAEDLDELSGQYRNKRLQRFIKGVRKELQLK